MATQIGDRIRAIDAPGMRHGDMARVTGIQDNGYLIWLWIDTKHDWWGKVR